MGENLSIDEIIRQAEEIRKKTIKTAQSTIEGINTSADEIINKEIEVPQIEPNVIDDLLDTAITSTKNEQRSGDKTTIIPCDEVKEKTGERAKVADDKTKAVPVSDKTKPVSVSDKTGVVNSVKDVHKKSNKFFKTNDENYEPIYAKKPPAIIEKPATIKSKSVFDKTADLEEIPTIVAIEELEKTKINLNSTPTPKSDYEQDDDDSQIVLEGFEDLSGKISKIDEDVAEEQLKQRRKDKVNKFRISSPDDTQKEQKTRRKVKNEFEKADEKTAFLEKLFESKASQNALTVLTAIVTIPILLITVFKDTGYLPSFLLDEVHYYVTLLVLYCLLLIVNINKIAHGFKLKGGINADTPIAICSLVVLAHSVMLFACDDLAVDYGSSYAFAMAIAFLLNGLGKVTMLQRIIHNFQFLTKQNKQYTIEPINNKVDAAIISRGVLTGEASLKTGIKTDFATNFLDIGTSSQPENKIAKTTGMIMILLNAILFGVITFLTDSWHIGFNIAICGLCISTPCIAQYIFNSVLLGVSDKIEDKGAMINGYEGAQTVDDTNAIVMEAADLFGANSCEIHGIKTFHGAKTDDAILQTAAVITKTKSPLAAAFNSVIIGNRSILPEVDGVIYEDRLGTSAWIYQKKILVGTRDLLIHHGITVLKEEFEKKFTRKGRKILYLAVAGKLMAMFVVSYNADPKLKSVLKKLEKSGMTILVKSNDPYINDESITKLFNLPEGFIRVMSSSNARAFEKYSDMYTEKSPAYAVHNGSALGFVSAMTAAENIDDTKSLASVLISFGCAIGFGVVALLGFINGYNQLTAVSVVVFQLIWCLFVKILTSFKRIGL